MFNITNTTSDRLE